MANVSRDSIEIIDLDRETVTHIDVLKKTYTVITFQQMKEQMEKAKNPGATQAPSDMGKEMQ
jgi:hypothetical protein